MNKTLPFIITIDGPAAAGKGTLGRRLSLAFDFAYLDTGKLYRAVAFIYSMLGDETDDSIRINKALEALEPSILNNSRLVEQDISELASKLASRSAVRQGLKQWQQSFCSYPPGNKAGAVLDGRDIGTVIAPHAQIKIFLKASEHVRARRRHQEALDRGEKSTYESVLDGIHLRDQRDASRDVSPCIPAKDAVIVDTDNSNIEKTFQICLELVRSRMSVEL